MTGADAWFGLPVGITGGVVLAGAYFLGCFSTGYYLVRARTGRDIRTIGTGSCGARNVSRELGSNGFAFTLAGDLAKGGVAVWLAQRLTGNDHVALLAVIAVTAGHVWPAQLGFRGGKGIATSLAGLLIYDCWLTLVYLLLFGAGFSLTRRSVASSLGGICTAAPGQFPLEAGHGACLGNCRPGRVHSSCPPRQCQGGSAVSDLPPEPERIMSERSLQFKVAAEEWEFEQIHQLNYRTFVEEIPQHQPSDRPRLVDRFHEENTYLICLCGNQVVGMIAMRGKRPFSLDQKLPNLDSHIPPGRHPCEIRLLSVERDFRNGQVFRGLTALVWQYGTDRGFNLAVISGTTRQQKLYRHLGFIPFGPLVGKGEAQFQPMYLTLETFEKNAEEFFRTPLRSAGPVSFLPGPVTIHRRVRRAFERPAESHRSDRFVAEFQKIRQRLCQLTSARQVEILLGSGTLGNDAVAAQLTLEKKPGVILANGEFGERLIDHAQRFGLSFDALKFSWGEAFDLAAIEQYLARTPALGWMWCVHSETSTGMLNPLPALQALCGRTKVKLCADCISSIGVTPVNLEQIFLATCASGKGLAAYPGLAMVFYNHTIAASKRLPRYLDLGWYAEHQGIAFTHSSNLLHALDAAVQREDWPKKFADLLDVSTRLRARLRRAGFALITADADIAPGVATIDLGPGLSSSDVGRELGQAGFLVSYNSDYLRRRNWIQICLMGEFVEEKLGALIERMQELCGLAEGNGVANGLVKNGAFGQKATASAGAAPS